MEIIAKNPKLLEIYTNNKKFNSIVVNLVQAADEGGDPLEILLFFAAETIEILDSK